MDLTEMICGWIGAGLSMFFFVSPIVPLIKLMKKEIEVKDIPGILLLCTLISCVLWTEYGIQIEKIHMWLCNGLGGSITIIWLMIYWVYFSNLEIIPSIVYNLLFLNMVGELFYICYFYAGLKYNDIVGYVSMVFNVLMFAAPGEKIFQVLKTNNLNILPIYSSICGTLCSSFWGVYGLAISDLKIIIPNGLGMLFSIMQIIVWIIVYKRRKNQPTLIEPISEEKDLYAI